MSEVVVGLVASFVRTNDTPQLAVHGGDTSISDCSGPTCSGILRLRTGKIGVSFTSVVVRNSVVSPRGVVTLAKHCRSVDVGGVGGRG